jgi:Homing endonuclease associated repeat
VSDKKHIIDCIASIARKLGRAPSHSEFIDRSGITAYSVMRCFECWNDAVRAAGLRPNTRNIKVEDRALPEDWGRQVRRNRGILTFHTYRRKGKYSPCTLQRRLGPWPKVPEVFRKFAKGKRGWADVLALLPVPKPKRTSEAKQDSAPSTSPNQVQHAPLEDRRTYGNPTNFRGLRHEPVNEQGVVLLFGMLAKHLGFLVEAVQNGFLDCEAKRQIGPERWQRVNIEFEFQSRKFRDHRHPLNGCDVIVCWRQNWDDCPKHIEVVELSSVVKSLANSEE